LFEEKMSLVEYNLESQHAPNGSPVYEIYKYLKSDHAKGRYPDVLSHGGVFVLCKVVVTFESVDEILRFDHWWDSHCTPLSIRAVCFSLSF